MTVRIGRREFITLVGGAAVAWPLTVLAQSGPQRRVGVLMNGAATDAEPQSYMAAFVQGLRQLGWVECSPACRRYGRVTP
jgi:putative tryptophan/tyrosine transport system substrate-binding protein